MEALPSPNDLPTNAIARTGLEGSEIERTTTAATVLAERGREMVRARIMQAVARPRDMLVVRERILSECKRPGFAAVAWYRKPVGGKNVAEGFSVRFAEAALRALGNIAVSQMIVFEDGHSRTLAVMATDLETNASTDVEVTLSKTVERKSVKAGQVVLGRRLNSYGDTTYLVEASEDEFQVKAASAIAKARRNVILQLVPGDIQWEARQQIEATRALGEKAVDPAARRKKLLDWFLATLGLKATHLAEYLGKPVDQATSEEMRDLNDLGQAILDKEITWAAAMEARETVDGQTGEVKPAAVDGKKVIEAVAKTKAKRAAAQTTAPAETAPAESNAQPAREPAAPELAAREALDPSEQLLRDAIDDAETPEDIEEAKAKLDAASSRLSAGAIGALLHELRKAAGRIPNAPKI